MADAAPPTPPSARPSIMLTKEVNVLSVSPILAATACVSTVYPGGSLNHLFGVSGFKGSSVNGTSHGVSSIISFSIPYSGAVIGSLFFRTLMLRNGDSAFGRSGALTTAGSGGGPATAG